MCIRDSNKNTINKIENKIKYKVKIEQLRNNQNQQHINNNTIKNGPHSHTYIIRWQN